MPADPPLTAGVDEAGRGALAGPLAVAAVILDPARPVAGLNDSKQLNARRREMLYARIIERALAWRIEFVAVDDIDRINILQATLTGMRRALIGLSPAPALALIDGNQLPAALPCPARALIGGDALEPCIMAASILAKVARDAHLQTLHAEFPHYGFDRHKGYPTSAHQQALRNHGPCPQHRRSTAPVQQCLQMFSLGEERSTNDATGRESETTP